jgi:hypothetical protein
LHKRRAILELIRTQLSALPDFGGCWIQRIAPKRESFPAITLFADSEGVEYISNISPRSQLRTLTVTVIVWVDSGVDDEKTEQDMDVFAAEIETQLTTPIGAHDLQLVSTDFQFTEDDFEISALTLTYRTTYTTTEFNPT